MELTESGLVFTFPDDWLVYQYDQHRFYRYVSGYGLKGVDFLIITPDDHLILLEVKNYYNRFAEAKQSPTLAIKNNPIAYAKKFTAKYIDSFFLIKAINQYYKSRHRYRWLVKPVLQYLPKGLQLKTDWGFWTHANVLLEKQEVKLMLWLELNEELLKGSPLAIEKAIRKYIVMELPEYPFSIQSTNKAETKIMASILKK